MMHSGEFATNETGLTTELTQRLAQALQAEQLAREEARTYNQLKQAFISNVSHELRTPLTILQGYIGLLAQHSLGTLTPEQHEALQIAQRNIDKLGRLINDLLDYSTLARGQAMLKSESVSLTAVCWESLREVFGLAQLRRIKLEQQILDTRDTVRGDPEKLRQIINHVLENAIKFSETDAQVMLSLQRRNDHLQVEVSDTGIGMTPEQLNQVFLPFVQGETGLARRFGGLGMGLSLIHHLVTLHGGEIEIRSSPGHGTTVTISLPVMTAAA